MDQQAPARPAATKMGSRRIFTPQFKLQVLESYRNDNDCKGNQRATARKYGIHRRQIQKWLQVENNLRSVVANSANHHQFHNNNNSTKQILLNNNNNNNSEMMKIISTSTDTAITRHRVVVGSTSSSNNTNMHKNSSATKYMSKTHQYNNSSNLTNVGGFISPVLSYACDQPAISFAPHHHHHHRMAPTPSNVHYEYESSSSASLSSPLQSSPNLSHYATQTTTITNTCNLLSRNGNSSSSPVHLSHHHHHHHPYAMPAFPSSSYHMGIIKPEPHLPVPSLHHLPPSFIAGEPHYYPAPVPSATPVSMPLYPTMSPRLTIKPEAAAELQVKQNAESAIDLSMPLHLKRIISSSKYAESRTPSPYDAKWVNVNASNNAACESDAIDLTCKKRKHSCSDDSSADNATPPAKVPKLFKPYLLDEDDEPKEDICENNNNNVNTETIKSEGFKKNSIASDDGQHLHRQKDAIIWNNHSAFSQYESSSAYRTPDSSYSSPPYTMSPYCEVPYVHLPPQSSPVSGYESSTSSIYSDESPPNAFSIAFKLQDVDNTFHSPTRNSTMIYA